MVINLTGYWYIPRKKKTPRNYSHGSVFRTRIRGQVPEKYSDTDQALDSVPGGGKTKKNLPDPATSKRGAAKSLCIKKVLFFFEKLLHYLKNLWNSMIVAIVDFTFWNKV
jgi:hypothetical protein